MNLSRLCSAPFGHRGREALCWHAHRYVRPEEWSRVTAELEGVAIAAAETRDCLTDDVRPSPAARVAAPDDLDREERVGRATVHGTCGELLQGYRRPDGRMGGSGRHGGSQDAGGYQHFLFTLPVAEFATTGTVRLDPGQREPRVIPPDRTRALTAAVSAARALGLTSAQVDLEIASNIPVGKGCASSTADVMASIAALLDATHTQTPDAVVHAFGGLVAKDIEWGDYLFSDSVALCLQRSHTLVREYETDLRWRIVSVDEGGVVDTAQFHERQRASRRQAQHFDLLARQLDTALRTGDYVTAAQIGTESALINQRELPKRTMPVMRRVAAHTGALGLAVAHTGTVIGLIFSEHQDDAALRMQESFRLLEADGLAPRTLSVRE
ncbi:GHMP family kinase ATP-binding protein [Solicola gregarius]|uniref:GHMP kinase N-terminal domain-containing protein n=1 Tax=Solicola gregarius TaxID=2908642 RepID=A0AA46YK42_9ACTN|nr:hypothetical protein [Solicola gregarius]UYM03628.1 hypothetical protein L0C25_13825 [Solicola gregarius]